MFLYTPIATAIGLTVYFVLFNMLLIRIQVVNPIVELTNHICNPQNQEQISKFIVAIKKREYERDFRIQELVRRKGRTRRRQWLK